MSDAYKCDMCDKVFTGPSRNNDIYFHPENDIVAVSIEYFCRGQDKYKKADVCPKCRNAFIKVVAAKLEKEG